jgi:hypothetical protein
MGLFNKIEHHAGKLFNKAMGSNGIFNKVNEYARKADNSVARVGHFIRPIASHFGLGDVVSGAVNRVHDVASNIRNANNSIRNGLERAVKAPIGDIQKSNYA